MSGFNNINQLQDPDYEGYFLATVKFNNDPERRQRVKVSIPHLLEGDPANLPWVTPILNAPFGMTTDSGVMQVPVLGALVVVKFQNGELYYGTVLGSVHGVDHTPNPALLLNYPKRRGWRDPAGNLFWIDITSGSVEMHYQHPSGTSIHINNAGDVTVNTPTRTDLTSPVVNVVAATSVTVTSPVVAVNATTTTITSPAINAIGNLTVTGNFEANGGTFKHNSKNVGATHTHSGVQTGGGNTGAPV